MAADIKIGTYHMADRPNLYEPARSNAFRFIIPEQINNLKPAGLSENMVTEEDYLKGTQQTIELAVATSSIPHFTLDTIEIRRANSVMKFAGVPSFSDGKITCNDYVGARVKDILLAWQARCYDVTADVVNKAETYKFDCTLVEYDVDFSRIIRKWILKGCWIKSLTEGDFSHDDTGKRTIDVTFEYDRAIPQIVK